jgi:flavin reductase (DIM6/NTAB) family NADH-FMN oxidoreductase RutF
MMSGYDDKELKQKAFDAVKNGRALLCSAAGDHAPVNAMTIGWGFWGTVWNKDVFLAYVRPGRHTFQNLKIWPRFSINLFFDDRYKNWFQVCGKESFRDKDKITDLGIPLKRGPQNIPFIEKADLVLLCRIIAVQGLDAGSLPEDVESRFYRGEDYHHLFYGEIIRVSGGSGDLL